MSISLSGIPSDLQLAKAKKLHLRKAFNSLKTHASAVANFTLQWQDLEDHLLSTRNSIETRIEELQKQPRSRENQSSADLESKVDLRETRLQSRRESKEIADNTVPFSQSPPEETRSVGTKLSPKEDQRIKRDSGGPVLNNIPLHEGKALLVYVIRNVKEHEWMSGLISDALKAAAEPGKLVLEAVKWFDPLDLKPGDIKGSARVRKRSCVLLLEALNNARSLINPQEREEAVKLASELKGKINAGVENSLEVLAFLQLCSAFGLVGSFDADEIWDILATIAKNKLAPDLIRSLGLADKVPDFVQKLREKKKWLEAIGFIYEFGLLDKFNPVSIIRDEIKRVDKLSKANRRKGNRSPEAQAEARDKEIAAIKAIINCIKRYKLASQISSGNLKSRIWHLRRQRRESQENAEAPAYTQQLSGKKRASPDGTERKLDEQKRNKDHWTGVSGEAASYTSAEEASSDHSLQPPYQSYLRPYAGTSVPSSLWNTSASADSPIDTIRPSHPLSSGLFADRCVHYPTGSTRPYATAENPTASTHQTISSSSPYGLASSFSAAHSMNFSAKSYGLSSSIPVDRDSSLLNGLFRSEAGLYCPRSSSTAIYGMNSLFGSEMLESAGSPTRVAVPSSGVSLNGSIPRYPRDFPRTSYYSDRPASYARGYR